jgi:hypothetical protein
MRIDLAGYDIERELPWQRTRHLTNAACSTRSGLPCYNLLQSNYTQMEDSFWRVLLEAQTYSEDERPFTL